MSETKRVVNERPNFSLVKPGDERRKAILEIIKVRPNCEISIEGMSELATGKIVGWDPARKFFAVKWAKKSATFEQKIDSESGLRAFFKLNLFSKVVLFKTIALRQMEDGTVHFRAPETFYAHQRRNTLRVPLNDSFQVILSTPIGDFKVSDMSLGGAKFMFPSSLGKTLSIGRSVAPVHLAIPSEPELSTLRFSFRTTSVHPNAMGCKFTEMKRRHRELLRSFLIRALHDYFVKNFKSEVNE